jgi:hypothetical protein
VALELVAELRRALVDEMLVELGVVVHQSVVFRPALSSEHSGAHRFSGQDGECTESSYSRKLLFRFVHIH